MYGSFAKGYYRLMKGNDYESIAEYYEKIFKKENISPELILDLGCGAGSLTKVMADKGYDMIGIDISEDMLNLAKNENQHDNILYLCQDMREFELYGTVDVIYSSYDCINYITSKRDLKKVFALAGNYLNPDGIMIFDLNTDAYFKNVLAENTHVFEEDDVYLVWQSGYEKRKCTFYLDMFYKNGKNYERFYEEQEQRAYSRAETENAVSGSGLKIIGFYKNLTFKKASDKDYKICVVLKKV